MIRLSAQAARLLRIVRSRHPGSLRVVGLPERSAVEELVQHNLVIETDVDTESTGYAATITARTTSSA